MNNQSDHTIVRLRVPPKLKHKIEQSAERNNRSQSAEMVARLNNSFVNEPVIDDKYKRWLLANIAKVVAEQADKEKPSFSEAIDKITQIVKG